MTRSILLTDAINRLFDLNVSKDSPYLRNKVNSLVRNGTIGVETGPKVQRETQYLEPGQEARLVNAVILNAFFPDPKVVKAIFEEPDSRIKAVEQIKVLLGERQSAMGIALQSDKVSELLSILKSGDLDTQKLPNPFKTLPQVALGKDSGLLHAMLLQASTLSAEDNLLQAYLVGDLELASELADKVETDHPDLQLLIAQIRREVSEIEEFHRTLDFFDKL